MGIFCPPSKEKIPEEEIKPGPLKQTPRHLVK